MHSCAFFDELTNVVNEGIDRIVFATDKPRVALRVEDINGRAVGHFVPAVPARRFKLIATR